MCSFTECRRPHYAKGYCHTHYWQFRAGRPLTPIRPRRPPSAVAERDDAGRKLCLRCQTWLAEGDFAPSASASDGLTPYCRTCKTIYSRAYRYGLDQPAVDALLAAQDGRCATCLESLDRTFCVDHDHACCPGIRSCGRCVRGLLCDLCNKTLGLMERDPETLQRMLRYIARRPHDGSGPERPHP